MILLGLRGVGKTVLLNEMRRSAEGEGILSGPIEAPEGQSLPAMLVPALRTAMLKLDRGQAAMTLAKRGLGALARFVKVLKLSYGELEASLDLGEIGVADNGRSRSRSHRSDRLGRSCSRQAWDSPRAVHR